MTARPEAVELAAAALKRAIGRARAASASGELTETMLDEAFARCDDLLAAVTAAVTDGHR